MKILPFLLLDLQANTSSFPVLGGWLHQSATWGEFTYITDLNLVAGPSGNRQGLWFVIWLRPFWWPCSWQSFEFHVCEVGWNYVSSNRKCGNWTLQDSKTECAKDPPDKVIWSGFLSSWTTISGGFAACNFLVSGMIKDLLMRKLQDLLSKGDLPAYRFYLNQQHVRLPKMSCGSHPRPVLLRGTGGNLGAIQRFPILPLHLHLCLYLYLDKSITVYIYITYVCGHVHVNMYVRDRSPHGPPGTRAHEESTGTRAHEESTGTRAHGHTRNPRAHGRRNQRNSGNMTESWQHCGGRTASPQKGIYGARSHSNAWRNDLRSRQTTTLRRTQTAAQESTKLR